MAQDIQFISRFSVSGFLPGVRIRKVLLYDMLPARKNWKYSLGFYTTYLSYYSLVFTGIEQLQANNSLWQIIRTIRHIPNALDDHIQLY